MDTDERLTDLKKAYADIILNTAKESAGRIMVSERKASRFEYELKNAKEDAIQMLLRLKQMMDFQITEAANVSCSQQKKIDELEAQLQEAEDIVNDLREELRTVESELESFSQSKEVKHTVQVLNAPTREPVTFAPNSNIDQTDKSQKLYNSLLPLNKSLISDLPSIILRSKETELYRNGCTQRIRACECKSPDIKSSFSVQTNDLNGNITHESILDIAVDNSSLTSPSSVKLKHTNDTTVDENITRMCNSESTSEQEVFLKGQEKDEVDFPSVSTTGSNVCKTSEVKSQPLTERVIKYTFQRKRKHVGSLKVNLNGESIPRKDTPGTSS